MMLHIPGVLSPAQVKAMRERLASADWIDGRASVGSQGAQVKRNRQLAEGSPLALEFGQLVSAALSANPLFFSSVLPLRILPPFVNSYAGGEHYGPHVDGAVRAQRGASPVRTDVSCTVFLKGTALAAHGLGGAGERLADHDGSGGTGERDAHRAGARPWRGWSGRRAGGEPQHEECGNGQRGSEFHG